MHEKKSENCTRMQKKIFLSLNKFYTDSYFLLQNSILANNGMGGTCKRDCEVFSAAWDSENHDSNKFEEECFQMNPKNDTLLIFTVIFV